LVCSAPEQEEVVIPVAVPRKRRRNLDATKFSDSQDKQSSESDVRFLDSQPPPGIGDEFSQSPPLQRASKMKMNTRNSGKPALPYKAPKKKRKGESPGVKALPAQLVEGQGLHTVKVGALGQVKALLATDGSGVMVGYGVVQLEATCLHGKKLPPGNNVVLVTSICKPKYPLPFPNTGDDPPQMYLVDAVDSFVMWPHIYLQS
jgi:hypothetical protein